LATILWADDANASEQLRAYFGIVDAIPLESSINVVWPRSNARV